MPQTPPPEEPRSLAEDLRGRDDAELETLLRERPDLLSPVPADMGQLAGRASTQASVARALDRLDRAHLQVLDVLAALPEPTTTEAVATWWGEDPTAHLEHLRRAGLVWGAPGQWRLLRTVRQMVGSPAGLGPSLLECLQAYGPARLASLVTGLGLGESSGDPVRDATRLAEHLGRPGVLAELLAEAPAPSRELAQRLSTSSPYGRVDDARRDVTVTTARTPVDWLLARGLLVATDADTVVLPREVAVHLRGGRVHVETLSEPPPLDTTVRDAALVDRTAGGAAFTVLRQVEELLELWGHSGPPILRAGGLGVRDLKRTALLLDLTEEQTAFVVELSYAAGLLGASGEVDDQWLPTPAYDTWAHEEPAQRWMVLVEAWLETTRSPGLVGSRDDRDKPVNALGPDLDRGSAPAVRRAALEQLAALPPGTTATRESLEQRLAWLKPRRGGRLRGDLLTWVLREAELLGVTGLAALSTPGRALLSGDHAAAVRALAALLPTPLDHVLLQADLTAVAPGPLETPLAHELGLVADVESKGGATVYRFTEASVRRALDAGRSVADLQEFLERVSRTPVPQPLRYLLDDVARRHGRLRVGVARAYLRCDDEGLLAELVADRRTAGLQLRRLAPTVVVAQTPVEDVLDRLRVAGYAPMAENASGDVVVRRPDSRRSPARQRPPRLVGEPPAPTATLVSAALRALRAGDRVSRTPRHPVDLPARPPGALPRSATSQTMAALQAAAAERAALWIGYVNNDGQASQRVIEPISLEGGYVSAFDHLREEVRTFAVHRITGVAAVAPPG